MFRIGHVDTQLIISEYIPQSVNSILYKEKPLSVKLGQFVFCHNYSMRQRAGVEQRLEYLSTWVRNALSCVCCTVQQQLRQQQH
jgi:hypothetical protein